MAAENTSTSAQTSVEAVVGESEFVTNINGGQAKKSGLLTDMAAHTALEEVESGRVDTMKNAGQGDVVSAENGQDHHPELNLKDNLDAEGCMMETDADQDEIATLIPATTGQTEIESKTLTLSPDINVNASEQVKQQKSTQVKVDPETEAREIFERFLKRLYGDYLKQIISASYKKRIVSYLQGEMNDPAFTEDQNYQLKTHVKQYKYVLIDIDANKVSGELTTTSTSRGDDTNIIMDSDKDGQIQSGKHTEKILMRPHYKTKELVPVPSQTEMYDIIKKRHLSVENHEKVLETHRHCQEKYGCIPKPAVRKYVSMCKECQMRKGYQKFPVGNKAPSQRKMKKMEKQKREMERKEKELARRGEQETEKEEGTPKEKGRRRTLDERRELLEPKQKKITKRKQSAEEQRRTAEIRKQERELQKERKEMEKLKKKKEAEEKKIRAEERKRLAELEATVKRLQREKDRITVGAKTKGGRVAAKKSPVKRGKKGDGEKRSPVKRGKKGEGHGEKRSPAKRKASAKETSIPKKKMKKRISPMTLVQYVILPGDVFRAEDLTTNQAVIQACHARTAVLQVFKEDENVIKYTSHFDDMHTEILETEDEEEMEAISEKLKSKNIDHILWMKSATNMATCIATKPYPRKRVQQLFKNLPQFLTE